MKKLLIILGAITISSQVLAASESYNIYNQSSQSIQYECSSHTGGYTAQTLASGANASCNVGNGDQIALSLTNISSVQLNVYCTQPFSDQTPQAAFNPGDTINVCYDSANNPLDDSEVYITN